MQIAWLQWNLHGIIMADTIGEQAFGRYREVVFVRGSIAHHTYDSIPAANESKSFT